MRIKVAQLSEQQNILEQYISGADNNWFDEVKESFFSHHIAPLRQSYPNQIVAMEEIIPVLEEAERNIQALM